MLRACFVITALAASLCGCNAVLGMERAHLDVDGGEPEGAGGATGKPAKGTGSSSAVATEAFAAECTMGSDACERCVESNCGIDDCLKDHTCRAALMNYTWCLDKNLCEPGNCRTFLNNTLENSNLLMPGCIDTCSDCTKDRGVLPICQLYCSCMSLTCTDEFASLGSSVDDCVQRCQTDGDLRNLALCRQTHCEVASTIAKSERSQHCQHAVGNPDFGFCTTRTKICTAGLPTGHAGCNVGSDCCSNKCEDNVCVE